MLCFWFNTVASIIEEDIEGSSVIEGESSLFILGSLLYEPMMSGDSVTSSTTSPS